MKNFLDQTLSQNPKQIQKLILSSQMQQALHLLQLPVMELSALVSEELEQNPVLEYSDPLPFREPIHKSGRERDDLRGFIENTLCHETSLFHHLMQQAKETFSSQRQLVCAEAIIGNFDSDGFLSIPLEEIALIHKLPTEELLAALLTIQTFDPSGVGARSLQESLLIQLKNRGKERSFAYRIIQDHYAEIIHNKLPKIAKTLRCPPMEIRKIVEKEIALLDLHPGANFPQGHYRPFTHNIFADVIVSEIDGDLLITINDEHVPLFHINSQYLDLLQEEGIPQETRDYIQEKMASAKWLERNLLERHNTLFRIAEQVAERQKDFLFDPSGKLTPLTMKELSEALSLHESTIARAVANKYVASPRGLMPLRCFFTNSYTTHSGENISSRSVKELVKEILAAEDSLSPLSDARISLLIKERGIDCARRTVAKYRKELGRGNASQRKHFS